MAPSQTAEPLVNSDKQSPTQENKPPIPTGAGAKKAMEAYFAGTNHMEFRQRSSSASRTTRTFSRGATPSREAVNAAPCVAGGVVEGAIDPDALKNALKKIPSSEKDPIRPTPPRSRSISRCRSPLPDEELLDESLPDFYKVTLKPTERTGSQTRDIRLAGNRLSRGATPSFEGAAAARNRLSRGATPTGVGASDDSVPEFRRVALRRTPSREQLADDRVHKESTLKKSVVEDASTTSSSLRTNLSRSGSFTSLTSINKSVLSRRSSTTAADEPEFKGVVLKKTGSSSRQGSRAGSPEQTGSRAQLNEGASLKKVESRSRRGSAASSEAPEFTGLTLKKSTRVQSEESKFQVESVSLKPIPVGEGEEASVASSASAGIRPEEEKASPVVSRRRDERASSTSRQKVQRETKFEGGDDEYSDIKSSLDKLKKKEAEAAEAAPRKEALPTDATDAKPIVYRRRKPLSSEEEEAEKVNLKPVNLKKRLSFSSSIECLVKKGAEEVDGEESSKRPPNLKRAPSFTSSLENIAVKEQGEKVHLSCFSKEMGSNVDLVQVCQDQGEGKHEVKLQFEIEGKQVKEKEEKEEEEEEEVEEWTETTTTTTTTTTTGIDGETGETSSGERVAKQEAEEEQEEGKLHKLRKAPSIDGLFQRQDVQAAFTFTLPFQKEELTPKLSLEIPNLA